MLWKQFLNHFDINLQRMANTKIFSCKSLNSSILLINAKSEHRFWDSFGTWLFWERRIGAHLLKIDSHISHIASSLLSELPIKLVMLNKLGGNEGAYLFFNNLGGSVVFFFTIFDSPRKEFLAALIYSEQSDEEFSKRKWVVSLWGGVWHSVR